MARPRALRLVPVLFFALATCLLGAAPATGAPEPDTTKGGTVTKTGWWWLANQPPAETGLVAHPQERPPNVQAGHLPVAATSGEADKISAIELKLDAKPGAFAKKATLVLRESEEPAANANADGAKVLACPVTEAFWADGQAARWDARPEYDCNIAQAVGERNDEGIWTFDITSLASIWLTPGSTGSSSLVLVEGAEAPASFQVTFVGLDEKGIDFKGRFGPPAQTPALGGTGPVGGAGGGGLGQSTGAGSLGGSPSSNGALSSGSLSSSTGGGAAVEPSPVDSGTVQETAPVTEQRALPVASPAAVPSWYAGLPKATVLLIVLALGLAYLAMLALGPDAQPAGATSRHGVSRALDRLRAAGAQPAAGVRR